MSRPSKPKEDSEAMEEENSGVFDQSYLRLFVDNEGANEELQKHTVGPNQTPDSWQAPIEEVDEEDTVEMKYNQFMRRVDKQANYTHRKTLKEPQLSDNCRNPERRLGYFTESCSNLKCQDFTKSTTGGSSEQNTAEKNRHYKHDRKHSLMTEMSHSGGIFIANQT